MEFPFKWLTVETAPLPRVNDRTDMNSSDDCLFHDMHESHHKSRNGVEDKKRYNNFGPKTIVWHLQYHRSTFVARVESQAPTNTQRSTRRHSIHVGREWLPRACAHSVSSLIFVYSRLVSPKSRPLENGRHW